MLRHTKYSDYMWTNSLTNIDSITYAFTIHIVSLVTTFSIRLMLKDSKYKNKWYSTDQFNLKDSKFIKVDGGVGDSLHHKISVLFGFMDVFWPVHFTLHL